MTGKGMGLKAVLLMAAAALLPGQTYYSTSGGSCVLDTDDFYCSGTTEMCREQAADYQRRLAEMCTSVTGAKWGVDERGNLIGGQEPVEPGRPVVGTVIYRGKLPVKSGQRRSRWLRLRGWLQSR